MVVQVATSCSTRTVITVAVTKVIEELVVFVEVVTLVSTTVVVCVEVWVTVRGKKIEPNPIPSIIRTSAPTSIDFEGNVRFSVVETTPM